MPHADLVTQTARRIEQAILSGRLVAGDQLPSEREISAEMGVSRSVVREALGRLASMGLVRSVHGSGTRVEAPSGKPIAAGYQILLRRGEVHLADVAAVRLPLETAIAAEAARRRTDDHLVRLEAAQAALADPRGFAGGPRQGRPGVSRDPGRGDRQSLVRHRADADPGAVDRDAAADSRPTRRGPGPRSSRPHPRRRSGRRSRRSRRGDAGPPRSELPAPFRERGE